MSDHTYTRLREYQKRIAAMLADPECSGSLLNLGIALLDFAVLKTADEKSWDYYAERAWGSDSYAAKWKLKDVLRRDIRRYDAVKDADTNTPGRECGAPMIRREGACGKPGSRRSLLRDPQTGRKQWIAACSRHTDWFNARVRANRQLNDDWSAEVVMPAANAGGVLARHIPEIAWEKTWLGLDPTWVKPPEAEPEIVPLKPRLELILGGAS